LVRRPAIMRSLQFVCSPGEEQCLKPAGTGPGFGSTFAGDPAKRATEHDADK
jgi:hypothetical protein